MNTTNTDEPATSTRVIVPVWMLTGLAFVLLAAATFTSLGLALTSHTFWANIAYASGLSALLAGPATLVFFVLGTTVSDTFPKRGHL